MYTNEKEIKKVGYKHIHERRFSRYNIAKMLLLLMKTFTASFLILSVNIRVFIGYQTVHTPLLGIETSANYAQNYTITARDSACTFTPPLLGIEMGCLERTLATHTTKKYGLCISPYLTVPAR